MNISYNEALDTLQSMFMDWDRENLATILKIHKGHMEQTVEAILRAPAPNAPIPSSTLINNDRGHQTQPKLRGRPVRLPDDFLQVPGPSDDNPMFADEQLATMLQDELFLQELMADPDLQSIGTEFMATSPAHTRTTQPPNTFNENTTPRGETHEESQNKWTIQSKMNELGTGMKKRLNDFAIKFKERNKTSAGHTRLTDEDENRKNNEEDDDDTEVISFEGPTIKQTRQKKTRPGEEIEIPEISKDHKHLSNKDLLDTDPRNKKFL